MATSQIKRTILPVSTLSFSGELLPNGRAAEVSEELVHLSVLMFSLVQKMVGDVLQCLQHPLESK